MLNLRLLVGALLFSFAVQSFIGLYFYIHIAIGHHSNQTKLHYIYLNSNMQFIAVFIAAVLTYRSVTSLRRRLRHAFQAQLARAVSDRIVDWRELGAVHLVVKDLLKEYVMKEELNSMRLATNPEFGANCRDGCFTKQEALDMFVKRANLSAFLTLCRSKFVTKEESAKFVIKEEDEARYASQQQRITELSQRLERFIAKEEAREVFVTSEDHATSISQQHEAMRSEMLKYIADNVRSATEKEGTSVDNDLYQAIILTINDIITQHGKDKKDLDETLKTLHNTVKYHHNQIELNQSTAQTLQIQHEESLTLHKTICLRIRAHTGPCPLVNETLQKQCTALPEHDLCGHMDALLEHTKQSFDSLVRLRQSFVPPCPQYYDQGWPVQYSAPSFAATSRLLRAQNAMDPVGSLTMSRHTTPVSRQDVGPLRALPDQDAGDGNEFDPPNDFGEY